MKILKNKTPPYFPEYYRFAKIGFFRNTIRQGEVPIIVNN